MNGAVLMVGPVQRWTELASLRSHLAGIGVSLGWIRVERSLQRKYSSNQPREPAGQPGGGRWTSGGSSDAALSPGGDDPQNTGATAAGSRTQEEVVAPDGSRVLTIRIHSNPREEWDEQHTITSTEGERTIVETSDRTQTIRDGQSGAILSRGTLTKDGVVPEAFTQTALRRPRGAAESLAARTVEALGTLFAALSAKNDYGRVIWAGPSSAYEVGDDVAADPIWVGGVSQSELDAACPRNGEVQALADEMAARVRASGNYLGPQDFGNKVHRLIADDINSQRDPNFIAEETYEPIPNQFGFRGAPHSIRLDVLEQSIPMTVCVYDHKTGSEGLRSRRVAQIITIVRKNFPGALRIIITEVRPRQ